MNYEELEKHIAEIESSDLKENVKKITLETLYEEGIRNIHFDLTQITDIFDSVPEDLEYEKFMYETGRNLLKTFDEKIVLEEAIKALPRSKDILGEEEFETLLNDMEEMLDKMTKEDKHE